LEKNLAHHEEEQSPTAMPCPPPRFSRPRHLEHHHCLVIDIEIEREKGKRLREEEKKEEERKMRKEEKIGSRLSIFRNYDSQML
jgi:hypothetical protein